VSAVELAELIGGIVFYALGTARALATVRSAGRGGLGEVRLWALAGVLFHGLLLVHLGVAEGRFPVTGAFEAFVFLAAAVTLAALALDALRRLSIVLVASLPLALATGLLALLMTLTPSEGGLDPEGVSSIWTSLHVFVALGAYGAFALAFLAGILYMVAQRQLKERAASPVLGMMPALETVARINVRSIAVGVVLLAAGLLVGYMHARNVYAGGRAWRLDPKIILTTLTVVAYSVVLALSARPGFKGRRTALASVASFVLVMATFWASVFWSDFHRFR
jgi:ABC-type transport system involved in cytochrome c biogenesis permease subunit